MYSYKHLTHEQKERRMLLFGCINSKEFELANKILDDVLKSSHVNKKKSVKNVQNS